MSVQHSNRLQTELYMSIYSVPPLLCQLKSQVSDEWWHVMIQDLAPVVLYSSWDQGFTQARLPSRQTLWQQALPSPAVGGVSDMDGFNSPSMCKEVFQFEAHDTSTVQAAQHVQRLLAGGTTSMRGSGSIALPPVAGSQVSVALSYSCAVNNCLLVGAGIASLLMVHKR